MELKKALEIIDSKSYDLIIDVIFLSENMFAIKASAVQDGSSGLTIASGYGSSKNITIARNEAILDLARILTYFNK